MTQEKKARDPENEIRIDYDNIDVEDIMSQIRRRIAASPPLEDPPDGSSPGFGSGLDYLPAPAEPGWKERLKRLFVRLLRPFFPLLKLLAYPLHKELRETIQALDAANRRLDSLYDRQIPRIEAEVSGFNINAQTRIDEAFREIHRLKEYSRLLHNLSHNLVVEMTKLKIEEETIKLKARILEKDFEFLGRKEKALEQEIFK